MSQSEHSKEHVRSGRTSAVRSLCLLIFTLSLMTLMTLSTSAFAQAEYADAAPGYSAESIRLVVGRVDGTRRGRKNIVRFQRALAQLPNVELVSTKDFTEQARGMRVDAILPEDSQSLTRLCDLLDIDAAVYAHVIREGRRNDLVVSVYAGENGQFVGDKVLKVSRGRLTRGLWSAAARQVLPLIQKAINM